jgi:hypothetical protein
MGGGEACNGADELKPEPKSSATGLPVTISQTIKVSKWSSFSGGVAVSEAKAGQGSGETGLVDARPAIVAVSDVQRPAATPAPKPAPPLAIVESPKLAPEQDAASTADALKAAAATTSAQPAEASEAGALRDPDHAMPMSSGERREHRFGALAAAVVLAAVAGAIGGVSATLGFPHFLGDDATSARLPSLEAWAARIDADILVLKASAEHSARTSVAQYSKTADRLDKVEKAQAEPGAKVAKLNEAVEKLRAAQQTAATSGAAEVTGSIGPVAAAPATDPKPADPKPAVARLPTLQGWLLLEVGNGAALIEGRHGIYEVSAGNAVPGLGRIDAIRRQDGRWVVVTTKGLIARR